MANSPSFFPTPASSWLPEPIFQWQREIDRALEDAFLGGRAGRSAGTLVTAPRIDVQESDDEIRVHADLPGIAPDDLDVRVEGDVLTLRGERRSESQRDERNFHVIERSQGRFQRAVRLPFRPDLEQVRAEVRQGVLEVRIPKQAAQERSRRIEVRSVDQAKPGSPAGAGAPTASSAAGSTGGTDGSDLEDAASASTAATGRSPGIASGQDRTQVPVGSASQDG